MDVMWTRPRFLLAVATRNGITASAEWCSARLPVEQEPIAIGGNGSGDVDHEDVRQQLTLLRAGRRLALGPGLFAPVRQGEGGVRRVAMDHRSTNTPTAESFRL